MRMKSLLGVDQYPKLLILVFPGKELYVFISG